ncbi:hypothetical protein SAMN05421747_105102 [Parapedobacter composti]|uniref:Uncharacterized protein n=2 Tax=Parapedobacter composti TaxID=623281 RepID=A0A1I1GUG0_9SPHI|nr:hypothetical protein SAMN05421747_105102 [Parapedobacter composti]
MVLLGGGLVMAACKKEAANIFNMFTDVTVTFHGDHPFSVTDYKLVNDGDSVYIDYTIASANEDMYAVVVEKVGGAQGNNPERTETVISDESERRSYSRILKLKMQRDGQTSYRIFAKNRVGHYMGDGYTKVTIEVRPSYRVIPDRRIFAPDSVSGTTPSFYSLMRGEAFSFAEGREHSADIDFGIRVRPDPRPAHANQLIYNYYSLSTDPNPFEPYDISDWEKRETIFSAPLTGQTNTFLYTLVSSSVIEEHAKSRDLTVTSTDFGTWQAGLAPGNLVYFLTPEGKYGAIHVNQSTKDLEGRPYINISVKMQR